MTFESIIKEKRLQLVKAICKEIVRLTPDFFTPGNLGLDVAAKNTEILSAWSNKYPDISNDLKKQLSAANIKFENSYNDFYKEVEDMLYDKCKSLDLFSYKNMPSRIIISNDESFIYLDILVKGDILYLPDNCAELKLRELDKSHNISKIVGGKDLTSVDIGVGEDIELDLTSSPNFKSMEENFRKHISLITPCKNQQQVYFIDNRGRRVKFSEQPRIIDVNYIHITANDFLTFDKNFDCRNSHTLSPLIGDLFASKIKDIYIDGSKDFFIQLLHSIDYRHDQVKLQSVVNEIETNFNVHYNQTRYK